MWKHVIVVRHPERLEEWTDINGEPGNWEVRPFVNLRREVVKDAIEALIASQIAHDLTISSEPPEAVMAHPDMTSGGTDVTVFCPVKRGDRAGMWVQLIMQEDGHFRQGELATGSGVVTMLRELGKSFAENSTMGFRKCLRSGLSGVRMISS